MKTNIFKKAAEIYKTVNYCLARTELYLHEASRK